MRVLECYFKPYTVKQVAITNSINMFVVAWVFSATCIQFPAPVLLSVLCIKAAVFLPTEFSAYVVHSGKVFCGLRLSWKPYLAMDNRECMEGFGNTCWLPHLKPKPKLTDFQIFYIFFKYRMFKIIPPDFCICRHCEVILTLSSLADSALPSQRWLGSLLIFIINSRCTGGEESKVLWPYLNC